MSIFTKLKAHRNATKAEYEAVNKNPYIKNAVQSCVMVVDIIIMFVLVWNMFTYFMPFGSWFNIVDGNSMYPTMKDGQLSFCDIGPIERGDIITTKAPAYAIENNPNYADMILVKRVIGMPGDRLIISEDGTVTINGETYDEPYLSDEAKYSTFEANKCTSVLLDENEYFVMGDNRGNSADSRDFGAVTSDDILYKQSLTPTSNFWLRLIFVALIFALDIFLYFLVEFILTELVYFIFFRKKKNQTNPSDNAVHTSSETVTLKGEK